MNPSARAARFNQKIQESDEAELKPVFTMDGVTYVYIKVISAQIIPHRSFRKIRRGRSAQIPSQACQCIGR